MKKQFLLLGILPFFALSSCDSVQQIANSVGNANVNTANTPANSPANGNLTNTEVSSGIKQALGNGLTTAVNALAVKDGFWGNTAVKILMPPEAQKIESALRSVGMGKVVDQFTLSLNRAAESAVKEAAPVFMNSLSQLTIVDAYNILLSGQKDAATTFFKRTTTNELTAKFSPIVQNALGQNKVNTYWNELSTAYNALPLSKNKINADLNAYVTQKAINGLFVEVAAQELKIRNNIGGARNTPLLSKVFGWADKQ